MSNFLQAVVSNCVLATIFALCVTLLSRTRLRPALLHGLWLLVLLKLFTPPVLQFQLTLPSVWSQQTSPGQPASELAQSSAAELVPEAAFVEATALPRQPGIAEFLVWGWLIGSGFLFATYCLRLLLFRRVVSRSTAAGAHLQQLAAGLASEMAVRRVPPVHELSIRVSPMVWCFLGRPKILLPSGLTEQIPQRLHTIIAHELAHVVRKDHWVRYIEFGAMTLFWWNPVVWWARRQLREMEEQACDSMVIQTLPSCARDYATALLETLEFLCDQQGPIPIAATAARPGVSLQRRIEMLKDHHSARRMTLRSVVALLAVTSIPMTLAFSSDSTASSDGESDVAAFSEFVAANPEALALGQFADYKAVAGSRGWVVLAFDKGTRKLAWSKELNLPSSDQLTEGTQILLHAGNGQLIVAAIQTNLRVVVREFDSESSELKAEILLLENKAKLEQMQKNMFLEFSPDLVCPLEPNRQFFDGQLNLANQNSLWCELHNINSGFCRNWSPGYTANANNLIWTPDSSPHRVEWLFDSHATRGADRPSVFESGKSYRFVLENRSVAGRVVSATEDWVKIATPSEKSPTLLNTRYIISAEQLMEAPKIEPAARDFRLEIRSDQTIKLGSEVFSGKEIDEFVEMLKQRLDENSRVVIVSSPKVAFSLVRKILAACEAAGVVDVRMAAKPTESF